MSRSPDASTRYAMFRPKSRALPVTSHTLFINSCLSSLHLLPGFRSSERCPQLGGCRPFPRSESSIKGIRILVAEQKCHFRNIHLRPVEVLVRQFLPRLKKQLPEGCAVIDDSTLQGPIAQPDLPRHGRHLRPASREHAFDNPFHLLPTRTLYPPHFNAPSA